ncbi:MAG: hypothetical protein P1U88_23260, partial [Thalassobaculaceae bacterium]|nr:hypothetical protein [Thalassobaculaceae bacterium]
SGSGQEFQNAFDVGHGSIGRPERAQRRTSAQHRVKPGAEGVVVGGEIVRIPLGQSIEMEIVADFKGLNRVAPSGEGIRVHGLERPEIGGDVDRPRDPIRSPGCHQGDPGCRVDILTGPRQMGHVDIVT